MAVNYSEIDFERLTEVSRKRTVVNAITNYGQFGIVALVSLFLQAYIIRSLGRNEYALWPLVNASLDFVALIPWGIGAGASRFIAHALGRKEPEEVKKIVSSLFAAMTATAIIYLAIIILISAYFERIFDIPPGAHGIGPWAMLLAGIGGAVRLPFSVFNGVLRALQKYPTLNLIDVISIFSKLLLIVCAFTIIYPSLIWVAGVTVVLSLLEGGLNLAALRRFTPWIKLKLKYFNWKVLWKVNNFSLLLLLLTISELLYWNTDYIFINKLLLPSLATGYAAVVSFMQMTRQLTSMGYMVMLPSATILHAQNDQRRIGRLIFRFNRSVVPFALSVLAFLMIFGEEVMTAYIGKEYAEFGGLFIILGIGVGCLLLHNSSGIVPIAHGKMVAVSLVSLASAVMNVLLTAYFILGLGWGLKGVAAGSAIALVCYRMGFLPLYAASLLKMPWLEYIVKSTLRPLLNAAPFIITAGIFYHTGWGGNLGQLLFVFAVAGLVQTIYMLVLGFDPKDRETVFEKIGEIYKRINQ